MKVKKRAEKLNTEFVVKYTDAKNKKYEEEKNTRPQE